MPDDRPDLDDDRLPPSAPGYYLRGYTYDDATPMRAITPEEHKKIHAYIRWRYRWYRRLWRWVTMARA